MWFEKYVCEYVYMHAVSCVMLWSHTAGDGAGSRVTLTLCIGVGGACSPGQCCQDTVLRVDFTCLTALELLRLISLVFVHSFIRPASGVLL